MLLRWLCIQSTFPILSVAIKITLELGETFRGRTKFISKQIEREISNKVTARYFTALRSYTAPKKKEAPWRLRRRHQIILKRFCLFLGGGLILHWKTSRFISLLNLFPSKLVKCFLLFTP